MPGFEKPTGSHQGDPWDELPGLRCLLNAKACQTSSTDVVVAMTRTRTATVLTTATTSTSSSAGPYTTTVTTTDTPQKPTRARRVLVEPESVPSSGTVVDGETGPATGSPTPAPTSVVHHGKQSAVPTVDNTTLIIFLSIVGVLIVALVAHTIYGFCRRRYKASRSDKRHSHGSSLSFWDRMTSRLSPRGHSRPPPISPPISPCSLKAEEEGRRQEQQSPSNPPTGLQLSHLPDFQDPAVEKSAFSEASTPDHDGNRSSFFDAVKANLGEMKASFPGIAHYRNSHFRRTEREMAQADKLSVDIASMRSFATDRHSGSSLGAKAQAPCETIEICLGESVVLEEYDKQQQQQHEEEEEEERLRREEQQQQQQQQQQKKKKQMMAEEMETWNEMRKKMSPFPAVKPFAPLSQVSY